MKAVRYHEYGDADVMRYEDADRPHPGAGGVLVRVAATSFNPVDAAIRAGHLQQVFPLRFPHTPGIDVAGTVAELGEGVTGLALGDAVIGFLPMNENGAAAEFVLAPAGVLTAAPSSIPLASAAALPAVGLTAWQALFEHANLQRGQRLLVNGAGGGVGGGVVQLAKSAGAIVIATASSRSAGTVAGYGADQIIDYTSTRLADAVTEPVDVVLNLVTASEPDMAAMVAMIRPGGVLVSTGSPARPDPERNVRALSMAVRSDADQLATLVARVDADELRVDITGTYHLSEIASVHEQSAAGRLHGKVLLTPAR
jgi:NADPH:quinone reductase-like Zn-dependent oxidoreductase